jgi:ABC-type transporter Mla subunit MlaD
MSPQLKRILGLVLVIFAAISLLLSTGGIFALWGASPAVTLALQDTAKLISETLDTTQTALSVADAALQNAAGTITMLSGSIDSLANSISNTQNALNSVTQLVKQELPTTIESARTALTSAQATARVVDNFLSGLSRIQFLNINYNPDVPLDSAIGQISDSLSELPAQLTNIGSDLDAVDQNLPTMISTIRRLGDTLGDVDTTIAEARTVIKEYAAQLARAQTAVRPIGARVPLYVTAFIAGLSFIMLWIIVVQIMALVIAWR